jgi:hypothetical protein
MVLVDILNASNITGVVGSVTYNAETYTQPIINVTVLNNLSGMQWGILCVLVYICAIVLHEFGHWMALYILKKEPHTSLFSYHGKIKLSTIPQVLTDTPQQRLYVIMSGILAGYIAIWFGALIHPYIWLLAIPYSTGFIGDIKKLALTIKEIRNGV